MAVCTLPFGFSDPNEFAPRIVVWGIPAPQGSKTYVGKGRMIESSKKLPAWRRAVSLAASALRSTLGAEWEPLDGPLWVSMRFSLPRPRRPKFELPAVPPDLDKLIRASCDPLTGVLWVDDARVVEIRGASKGYAGNDGFLDEPGAVITVGRI